MIQLLWLFTGVVLVVYGIAEWRRHKLLKRWDAMTTKHEQIVDTLHELLHDNKHIDRDRLMEAVEQGDTRIAEEDR